MARSRFTPLLIGDGAPSLRAPSLATLRRNAAKKKRPAKKAKKKAAKRKVAKKKTPLRGGKRGKRGGTVKATGKFEHLRARSPSSFVKSSFKTIPWAFASEADQKMVKKILGLRTIPKGAKVITGKFKPGAKKDRVPGKRVKYLANGIQSVLIPIKGGKTAKSPAGTKRKSKKAAKKIVKRATRKNPGRLAILANPKKKATKKATKKRARRNPARCKALYGVRVLKNPAPKRRPDLEHWVDKDGAENVIDDLNEYRNLAVQTGAMGVARATQSDIDYLRKRYKVKRPSLKSGWGKGKTRTNPGRLAILANPLPKAVEESANAMRGEKKRRFLSYYSSLKPADQKRLVKGLQLYKKRHKVPCNDFELKKVKGTRPKIEVGVGKARAIEYHANKGYKGSSKKGDPYRHEFENGQHVVSNELGRNLEVVDRKGAKKKTVTTDWIYN